MSNREVCETILCSLEDIFDRQRVAFVVDRLRSAFVECKNVYVAPYIPRDKALKAIRKYAPQAADEQILMLIDDTLFTGSGREGGLLTHRHLYAHNFWENSKCIALKDIANVEVVPERTIHINGEKFLDNVTGTELSVDRLVHLLESIVECLQQPLPNVYAGLTPQQLIISATRFLQRNAVSMFRSELEGKGMHITPFLPIDKAMTALDTYAAPAIDAGEEPLLLLDDTLFTRSARDGLLLTERRLYAHNLGESEAKSVVLRDIHEVDVTTAQSGYNGCVLEVNGEAFLQASQPPLKSVQALKELLKEMIQAEKVVSIAAANVGLQASSGNEGVESELLDGAMAWEIDPEAVQLQEPVAPGGVGEVWLGKLRQGYTLMPVGIRKYLTGEFFPSEVQAFAAELLKLHGASLHCKFVVKLLGVCSKSTSFLAITQPYVSTVESRMGEAGGALRPGQVRRFSAYVCKALAELHDAGLVAQDVRPATLVLDERERALLADVGVAALRERIGSSRRTLHPSLWRARYLAPEQWQKGPIITAAADVWGLACTLLEMATGDPPWVDSESTSGIQDTVVSGSELPGTIPSGFFPDELEAVLPRCFERDPARRPTAKELLAIFQNHLRAWPGESSQAPLASPNFAFDSKESEEELAAELERLGVEEALVPNVVRITTALGRAARRSDDKALEAAADALKEVLAEAETPEMQAAAINTVVRGANALHRCCVAGNGECMRLLLAVPGVDVEALDEDGDTPLLACLSHPTHSAPLLGLLLRAGAHPNACQPKSLNTALHQALLCGNDRAAVVLINNGASLMARNARGATPLHVAATRNCPDARDLLLDVADPDGILAVDEDGDTPLHVALQLLAGSSESAVGVFSEQQAYFFATASKFIKTDPRLLGIRNRKDVAACDLINRLPEDISAMLTVLLPPEEQAPEPAKATPELIKAHVQDGAEAPMTNGASDGDDREFLDAESNGLEEPVAA
eukprot:jgi/Chlat1/5560/Chrsp369S00846